MLQRHLFFIFIFESKEKERREGGREEGKGARRAGRAGRAGGRKGSKGSKGREY